MVTGICFLCHIQKMKDNHTAIAYPALLGAVLAWGSSFVVLKIAFRDFDPLFVIFGRMFLGLLFFIPILIKGIPRVRKKDWFLIVSMAFFEPCLYFLFEAKALTLTTAGQAGMITSLMPLMVGIAAHFLLKERLNRAMLTGFILAMGGVIWLTLAGQPSQEAPHPILGNVMELLAMVCAAGYTLALKKLTSRYSSFFLTGIQSLTGALFFLPFILISPERIPSVWTASGILAVIYLGVVVTIGGYGLFNFGTSRIPASRSSAFINLIPVISLFLSVIILNEQIVLSQFLASALILSGVFLSQKKRPFRRIPVPAA